MLTEDEAKAKWCPFARICVSEKDGSEASVASFNRIAHRQTSNLLTPHAANCIASACMAWRWASPTPIILDDGSEETHEWLLSRGWTRGREAFVGIEMNPPKTPQGYCGLAGRIE